VLLVAGKNLWSHQEVVSAHDCHAFVAVMKSMLELIRVRDNLICGFCLDIFKLILIFLK
jgi:hypothetical protein